MLAAIAMGARSFSEISHDTGLSTSTTAAALHSLEDLGLIRHDGEAWALRSEGFADQAEFNEVDLDAPRMWTTSNSEAPCIVVAGLTHAENSGLRRMQQQPETTSNSEVLHNQSTTLDPELAGLVEQIRRLCPDFNPRPQASLEDWALHWQDRRHRMHQHLAHLADPKNLRTVKNVSAWIRSGVEHNWAPIRTLTKTQTTQERQERVR